MKVIQGNDKQFVLVYGPSGTGKTHLSSTLGELGKVLIIDVDQGSNTIFSDKINKKHADNITVVDFTTFADLDAAFQAVKKNTPEHWSKVFGETIEHSFDWVVWDTWSELQYFMREGNRIQNDHSKFAGKFEWRNSLTQPQWGQIYDLNMLAIRELRKLPIKQLFIMQEATFKDDDTGVVTGGPSISGKMVQEFPALFDTVVHQTVNLRGEFLSSTQAKGRFPAKSRKKPPAVYTNSTLKDILY